MKRYQSKFKEDVNSINSFIKELTSIAPNLTATRLNRSEYGISITDVIDAKTMTVIVDLTNY